MKNIVALIDCQNDFIDGSLGVGYDKWAKAYEYIENLLENLDYEKYDLIFTKDNHPSYHCSFKEQGGLWPSHCVENTFGSEIYWKLATKAQLYKVINKGEDPEKEEYGIDVLKNMSNVKEINIMGLCTDYCVKETAIMTAKAHPDTNVKVHLKGSAYISEDTLNKAVKEMEKISNIEIIK